MITYDLVCRAAGHRFEGWFGSSSDFAAQQERGLVACPQCGSVDVIKAPMAPNLARKGNQRSAPETKLPVPVSEAPAQAMSNAAMPPEALRMMQAMALMQAKVLKQSSWVGEKFAEVSRAMHYGEQEVQAIHGQATLQQAEELLEEGIEVAPLPFPVAPPGEAN